MATPCLSLRRSRTLALQVCCILSCLGLLSTSSLAALFGAPPVKVVQTPHGDVFHCVNIQDQEGLKHPKLSGHKVQPLGDSRVPEFVKDESLSSRLTPLPSLNCPHGTVPQLGLPHANHDLYSYNGPQNVSMKFVSSQPTAVPTVDAGHYYEVVSTGVFGLLDIWKPNVENSASEFSGTFVSVSSGTDRILAGWLVYPGLYYDDYPRFTIASTKDNFKAKTCFNAACGFVVVNNTIGLGLKLAAISSSVIRSISLSITQDTSAGGWVLTANQNTIIGYWPNTLFSSLNSGLATQVSWSGRIANSYPSGRYTKTQMGNGIPASSNTAAAISYLIYVDTSGQFQLPTTTPRAPSKCYTVRFTTISTANGPISNIFYGGSGYNSGCTTTRKPPVRPSPPPPPFLTQEDRSLFLNAPLPTKYKNSYFRYASYRYTGDAEKPNWDLTASINFVALDQVSEIENQGECNACWAFAPAAALESLYANATGLGAPIVSKQAILDCAPT